MAAAGDGGETGADGAAAAEGAAAAADGGEAAAGDGGEAEAPAAEEAPATNIVLNFAHMDDFTPLNVVNHIPALADLYSIRSHLKDLLTKLDGNDPLEALLKRLMTDGAFKDEVVADLEKASNADGAENAGDGAEAGAEGGDGAEPSAG
jgi:hypothetical protein